MGDNSRIESVRVVVLVCDTPKCPLQLYQYHDNISKGIELWPAQYFITMGDNSRTESARVVILVRDTSTQCPLPIGEVP